MDLAAPPDGKINVADGINVSLKEPTTPIVAVGSETTNQTLTLDVETDTMEKRAETNAMDEQVHGSKDLSDTPEANTKTIEGLVNVGFENQRPWAKRKQ